MRPGTVSPAEGDVSPAEGKSVSQLQVLCVLEKREYKAVVAGSGAGVTDPL